MGHSLSMAANFWSTPRPHPLYEYIDACTNYNLLETGKSVHQYIDDLNPATTVGVITT